QFGGTLGGPVSIPKLYNGRDKTFFFASYEGMRERQGLVLNSSVPTAALKRGDFSAMTSRRINDPLTGAPFTNNVIPTARLSPQALFSSNSTPDQNPPPEPFPPPPPRKWNTNNLTALLDQRIPKNPRLFIRWIFHDNRLNEPHAFPALGYAPLKT